MVLLKSESRQAISSDVVFVVVPHTSVHGEPSTVRKAEMGVAMARSHQAHRTAIMMRPHTVSLVSVYLIPQILIKLVDRLLYGYFPRYKCSFNRTNVELEIGPS